MSKPKNKPLSYFLEIAKWLIPIWALWPLLTFQAEKMTLWRMMLGVLFTVIYLGKMFYDLLLDNFKQRKERYTIVDLLMLVGFITIVAVLIGGAILVVGMYVTTQFQE